MNLDKAKVEEERPPAFVAPPLPAIFPDSLSLPQKSHRLKDITLREEGEVHGLLDHLRPAVEDARVAAGQGEAKGVEPLKTDEVGWNGMGWNGMEWDGMGWDGMGYDGMEWDGMGWDGMGWDGMGWDGMEWNGMAWDGMGWEVM